MWARASPGASIGIIGNQVVARYKLVVGRRIGSATLVADARHSWLDALSSAGALVGLIAVALGQPWGDPVAGLAITAFICHVGYEVTSDVVHRLADGIDPDVIHTAEAAAGSVPGVIHAHARARWTGRTLRVEIEGWVDPDLPAREADALGRQVADAIAGSSRKPAASRGQPELHRPDFAAALGGWPTPSSAAGSGRRGRRARCVPDRPVNAGKSRSLPGSPVHRSPANRQADPLRKQTF